MEIRIRFFKDDGKERVESMNPLAVTLEGGFQEIEKLSSLYEGNFVGFVNELGDMVQFIRLEQDDWLVDAPILENGGFSRSVQASAQYCSSQANSKAVRKRRELEGSRGTQGTSLTNFESFSGCRHLDGAGQSKTKLPKA